MAESVIMNMKSDVSPNGESRNQPFIIWLQFMNFAMVSAICWVLLKIYRGFLSICEWMFPFQCNTFYNPLILVIGTKNDLNEEIVRQLSDCFRSNIIRLKDVNENTSSLMEAQKSNKSSRIIYTHLEAGTQEGITKLASDVRKTFGEIDLLIISHNDEPVGNGSASHVFLNNLNKQLLIQFWIVMAFLPGMLKRNNGHIISVALGRTSALTNTGIVRSVCEELLLSNTNVKLTLVEKNSLIGGLLPTLPSDILAKLIIKSIWTSTSIVEVPTIFQYLIMMPIVITRYLLQPILWMLNILTINRSK